jgi:hypothetical protein
VCEGGWGCSFVVRCQKLCSTWSPCVVDLKWRKIFIHNGTEVNLNAYISLHAIEFCHSIQIFFINMCGVL